MDPITLIVAIQITTAQRHLEMKSFRDMPTCEVVAQERRKDPDVISAKRQRPYEPVMDPEGNDGSLAVEPGAVGSGPCPPKKMEAEIKRPPKAEIVT